MVFWPLMSTKCRRSPTAGIIGSRENIPESDKRFTEFCCGGGGGGFGGDEDAFIDSVRGIIHFGLQDCHSCVGSGHVCYFFSKLTNIAVKSERIKFLY